MHGGGTAHLDRTDLMDTSERKAPMTMITSVPTADSVAGLATTRRLVAERFDRDEPLTKAALELIDCAAEVVAQLPGGDLESAQSALGSARAAVVSATYAVRRIHDTTRTAAP
jgi:hypothetical protein